MKVDVRSNIAAVKAQIPAARDDLVNRATVNALNRAATTVRAEASKEIRKIFNLKASAIKAKIDLRRASKGRLEAHVVASGKRISLSEFGARWNRRMPGVSVQVYRQGARKTVRGSWLMPTKSGYVGAFRRVGRERYPIEFLTSVGFGQMFKSKQLTNALKTIAQDRFQVVLTQELKFRTGR